MNPRTPNVAAVTDPAAARAVRPAPASTAPPTSRLDAAARDRLYARCALAITEATPVREPLLLARLVLLLIEEVGDEHRCHRAIEAASRELPVPSLSAGPVSGAGA